MSRFAVLDLSFVASDPQQKSSRQAFALDWLAKQSAFDEPFVTGHLCASVVPEASVPRMSQ